MTTPREGIIKLLSSSQNISLLDVVRDQYFQPAIQSSVPEIFDFLFSPRIINQILDIILTTKPPSEYFGISNEFNDRTQSLPTVQEFRSITDILSKVLTTKISKIKARVIADTNICNYLNKFINESAETTNRKISGSFSMITKHLVYETDGNYIHKILGLFNFLINRLYILSYGKLLKSILRKFPNQFELPIDAMIEQILSNAINDKQKTFFCLMIIKSLLKKPEFVYQFIIPIAKHNNIKKLIIIASNSNPSQSFYSEKKSIIEKEAVPIRPINDQLFSPSCTYMATEILKIILQNIDKVTDFSEKSLISNLIAESEHLFTSVENPHDPRLCSLIFLFKNHITKNVINPISSTQEISLIDSFFRGETSTFVSNSILDYIKNLNDENFINFIEDEKIGVISRIINYDFQKSSKINGHITELAKIINDRKDISPKIRSSQQWEKYRKNVFLPHIELVASIYGGGYPEKYDNSASDDENKNSITDSMKSRNNQNVEALNCIDFDYCNPHFTNQNSRIGSFPIQTVIGSDAFSRNSSLREESDDEYSGSASDEEVYSGSASGSYSGSGSASDEENDEEIKIVENVKVNCIDLNATNKNEEIGKLNQKSNEITNATFHNDCGVVATPLRNRKRGTFQSNDLSYLPNFQNRSDEEQFHSIINNNNDDEGDKIEDEKGEASPVFVPKPNSYDPRFANPKWSGISSNDSSSCNDAISPSPLSRPHSMGFYNSFSNSQQTCNNFSYINFNQCNAQSSDDKLNIDKVPSFSSIPETNPQPILVRNRNSRRRFGNAVSIDDVPPSLRKFPSNNPLATNGPK